MSVNYYRSAKPDEVNGQNFEFIGQRTDPMLPGLMVALDERDAIGADRDRTHRPRQCRQHAPEASGQRHQGLGFGRSRRCGAPALPWSSMTCPGKHKDLYQNHKVACAATRIDDQPALRISPHVYNTPEELDRLAGLVAA